MINKGIDKCIKQFEFEKVKQVLKGEVDQKDRSEYLSSNKLIEIGDDSIM